MTTDHRDGGPYSQHGKSPSGSKTGRKMLASFPHQGGLLLHPPAASQHSWATSVPAFISSLSVPTSSLFTSAWQGSPKLFCLSRDKGKTPPAQDTSKQPEFSSVLTATNSPGCPLAEHLPEKAAGCSAHLLLPAACWAAWIISNTRLSELQGAEPSCL